MAKQEVRDRHNGFDIDEAVVIKDENLFLLTHRNAAIPVEGVHPLGLYYNDCRFLSGWELELMDAKPRSLVVDASAGSSAIYELTNREMTVEHGRLPGQTIQVRLERDLQRGHVLEERILVSSFDPHAVEAVIRVRLHAGFEPMMWVRGMAREFVPKAPRREATPDSISFTVKSRDGVVRRLETHLRPRPARTSGGVVEWRLRLEAGRPQTLVLRHAVSEDGEPRAPRQQPALRRRRSVTKGADGGVTRVTSDDQLFDRIVERSISDLRMLGSRFGHERYFAAGTPWYATLFGRDSLITAHQMLAFDPSMTEGTLRLLARNLGKEANARNDEEPGKVLHEVRVGELSNLGILPYARYYGSVDSTALFLCLAAEHADWTGDLGLFRELEPAIEAALGWLDQYADMDGDGLIEYERGTPEGLRNQGWKDSDDAIIDERGQPLAGPIALVEVQGYAVRAKRRLADVYEYARQTHRAEQLREEAIELRHHIDRFWLAREGYYSMALDGRKRASRVLASNQGHLLWSLAVSPERAAQTRDALMGPDLFCGWGIRTLAASSPAYNPIGYHTGSVWPHDSGLIAYGLRKYGYDDDFTLIFEGLLEAASRFPNFRLPELFGGFSREQYERPVPYPVACHPQAWAAGTIPYLLRSGLGLIPDALHGRLRVVRPTLPRWLGRVDVHGLKVGGATVDLSFERAGDRVTIADVKIEGDVEVVLEISASREPEFGL